MKLHSVIWVYTYLFLRLTPDLMAAQRFSSETSNCSSTILITVVTNSTHSECEQVTSNATVCGSLQTATEAVLAYQDSDCVAIMISSGQHRVTNPVNFGAISVHLVGMSSTDVSVLCEYVVNPEKQYTWYFNQSDEVVMENLVVENCPYPIRIDTVRRVNISDASFAYFEQAALDLFNCEQISINNAFVYNNTGRGLVQQSFRGNTGGVAIGYSNIPSYFKTPIQVNLKHCKFVNNSANTFLGSERAISRRVFIGRGGALGIYIDSSLHNVTINVSDSVFSDNFARVYGGGTFILINAVNNTQSIVEFSRTNFTSNGGGLGGGAVFVGFLSSGAPSHPNTIIFSSCNFTNNIGESGGAMYVLTSFIASDGSLLQLERSNFTGNRGRGTQNDFGAAVAFAIFTIFRQRVTLSRHRVTDCTFYKNVGINGVFSIGYAPAKFSGTNQFTGNTGTALRITGSLVDVQGNLSFVNNSVETDEGALTLLSFGQIRLGEGTQVRFEGNVGRTGSSIIVDTPASITTNHRLLFNSMCFLLFEEAELPPSQWNASVTFDGNKAVLASAIYLSRIDACSWSGVTPPFFNDSYFTDWPIWDFHDNVNTGYKDPRNPDYYIGTKAIQLSLTQQMVTAFPGQKFPLSLSGIDYYNHPTSTNARFLFQTHGNSRMDYAGVVRFSPGIVVVAGSQNGSLVEEIQMQYSISNSSILEELDSGVVSLEEPFEDLPTETDYYTLHLIPCPGGYYLREAPETGLSECACLDSGEVVNCEDDQDSIILKRGLWAGHTPSREPNLFFYPCPPDYCHCTHNSSLGPTRCVFMYTQSDANLQCNPMREGVFCGQCRNESGVSVLLNKCVSCSDAFVTLLFVLIAIDVAIFVVITLMDRPFPDVAYPLVFYLQLAPYVSQYYPESFEAVGKYLYFLGSATGFYFIYDFCLLGSLPILLSFFLRYIPTFTAALVYPLVLLFRNCFKRKSLANHGYWWLMVLLYTSVAHTSLSLLDCPQTENKDSSSSFRWFWNGQVECFSGGHLALTLLAIFMLLVCIATVVLTVVLPLKRPRFAKRYLFPLTVSFRSDVPWWSGVELGRRLLFLLFFVSFPRNAVYASLVLVVIIALYGYVQPYRSRVANILELLFLINFFIFILLEDTSLIRDSLFKFTFKDGTKIHDAGSSISPLTWLLMPFYYLPVVVFILLCAAYVALFLWKNHCKRFNQQPEPNAMSTPEELFESSYFTMDQRRVTSTTVELDQDGKLQATAGVVEQT